MSAVLAGAGFSGTAGGQRHGASRRFQGTDRFCVCVRACVRACVSRFFSSRKNIVSKNGETETEIERQRQVETKEEQEGQEEKEEGFNEPEIFVPTRKLQT